MLSLLTVSTTVNMFAWFAFSQFSPYAKTLRILSAEDVATTTLILNERQTVSNQAQLKAKSDARKLRDNRSSRRSQALKGDLADAFGDMWIEPASTPQLAPVANQDPLPQRAAIRPIGLQHDTPRQEVGETPSAQFQPQPKAGSTNEIGLIFTPQNRATKGGFVGTKTAPKVGGQTTQKVGGQVGGQPEVEPHLATPPKPPKKSRGTWVIYETRKGKRYCYRQWWEYQESKRVKLRKKRIKSVEPMSEKQYLGLKKHERKAKRNAKRNRR